MAGRSGQAIPVSGPIPLPLYEFGSDIERDTGTLTVSPFDERPLYLSFDAASGALLDVKDVEDLIAYCKVWLRAVKSHKAAIADTAAEIKRMGAAEL